MASATLMVPKASQDALQSAVPLIAAAICVNAKIPVDVTKVADSAPSRRTIDRMVGEAAVDVLLKINNTIRKNPKMYGVFDKANGDKKG